MIIKDKTTSSKKSIFPYIVGIVLMVLLIGYIYKLLSTDQTQNNVTIISCDAEKVEGVTFKNDDGISFNNGQTQSKEKSYSGTFASKVDPNNRYGISYEIQGYEAGTKYTARIKRFTLNPDKTYLAINGNKGSELSVQTNKASIKEENGWETLEISLTPTTSDPAGYLRIFPYASGNEVTAYFDDLEIIVSKIDDVKEAPLPKLHLYLDQKALNKLNEKRNEAIRNGILQSSDDDWVKGKLTEEDSISYDVKLRLKGDWTDHLKGDYWSYRIKMPGDKSWNRLMTFSLQDPVTRDYLHEWFYHKVLEKHDILTPRYGFIQFQQNEQRPIVYAYEEHFEKQIAEFKNRREGVILKFSEDGLWAQRLRNRGMEKGDVHENARFNADIAAFKEKKTLSSPNLKEQFDFAQNLLYSYKYRLLPPSEIFDVEKLAGYYALLDILDAFHGALWHNQRFYYNNITRKLEPIGFDGYTETGPMRAYAHLFFGEFMSSEEENDWNNYYKDIFRDTVFNQFYIPKLYQYSDPEYIQQMFDEWQGEIYNLEKIFKMEGIKNPLDRNKIKKRAKAIHQNISPYHEHSLKVFTQNDGTILVSNHHPLPLEVIGYGFKKGEQPEVQISSEIIYSNERRGKPRFTPISDIPQNAKYVYFVLPGTDVTRYSSVKPWNYPTIAPVDYSRKRPLAIPLPEGSYDVNNNQISIRNGAYTLNESMFIPEGYRLIMEAGTTIDLKNESYILSYSPVFLNGSSQSPIQLLSSDGSAQGFVVIQASDQSQLQYTVIEGMGALMDQEWQLTGAVTFYESDVSMNTVTIRKNSCEDALNIVRSNFDIEKLNINQTFADGFDGDFCKGTIRSSVLSDTGNDGLDYSGSVVTVDKVQMNNIGDKGISAGEEATLTISNVQIDGAEIGVASKDLSKVTINSIALNNCTQGFAAYRKKPEFGGGHIDVLNYSADNVKQLTILDEESTINLPN